MKYPDYLQAITALQEQIAELGPMTPEQQVKLWTRIRLDWNYHSNAIEGNTLTMSETSSLLFQGIHAGNKLGKHYEEMRLHDRVLEWVRPLVQFPDKEDYKITEKLIRDLHHFLMGEEYEIDAEDSLGNPSKIVGCPGQYKEKVNKVRQGELMYYYASPEEVPALMQELVEWLNTERAKPIAERLHPVTLATLFHLRFVTIHPFDDGNGRMGRLLTNIILMQERLAPAIIEQEQRQAYILALSTVQTTGEAPNQLLELYAKAVLKGMDLRYKAHKGESLRRLDDWEKEAAVLARKLEAIQSDYTVMRSDEAIGKVVGYFCLEWFAKIKAVFEEKFEDFFEKTSYIINKNQGGESIELDKYLHYIKNKDLSLHYTVNHIKNEIVNLNRMELIVDFYNLKLPNHSRSITLGLYINFKKYYYTIKSDNKRIQLNLKEYKYDALPSAAELDQLTATIGDYMVKEIKEAVENHNNGGGS